MKVRGKGYCCVVAVMLITAGLMSCGGPNGGLAEVERLLETDPVRADSLLSTFPVPDSRKGRALYAILRTQADYKNYKDIPDDRLIR